MSKTFKLSKAIKLPRDGGFTDLQEITLRDPTADDLFENDIPYAILREGDAVQVKPDGRALKKWLPRLAGMSVAEFGQIPARDVMPMFNWLSGQLSGADAGNSA